MIAHLAKYNKALLLLGAIVLAVIAQSLGIDLGLDVEHYVALLFIDLGIYAVPNKDAK